MAADKIDMSLDDIIKIDGISGVKRGQGAGGASRRGGGNNNTNSSGGGGGGGVNSNNNNNNNRGAMRNKMNRNSARAGPYLRASKIPDQWQHDMFDGSSRGGASGSNHLLVSNLDYSVSDKDSFVEFGGSKKAAVPQESEAIMKAVQLSEQNPDLIGDFSQPYALPVCSGKHSDLKTIKSETLASLIRGQFKNMVDSYIIIDGRYPYEFEGGHIVGAINIYNKLALRREFLDNQQENIGQMIDENTESVKKHRNILIFHCEFSSERGPSLSRFLRNKDREINTSRYPQLYHPEIYILDGGYKAFYEKFKELCTPQSYLPMLSKDHKEQMKQFRVKSKSCNLEANKATSHPKKETKKIVKFIHYNRSN